MDKVQHGWIEIRFLKYGNCWKRLDIRHGKIFWQNIILQAIAIAVSFIFTRVLAWIPSPVYVGSAIDAACLRWSQLFRDKGDVIEFGTQQGRHHCEVRTPAFTDWLCMGQGVLERLGMCIAYIISVSLHAIIKL